MIKLAVVTALIAFLKVVVDNYLPGFPISTELINSIVYALLLLLGVDVVEFAARNTKLFRKMKELGLWK